MRHIFYALAVMVPDPPPVLDYASVRRTNHARLPLALASTFAAGVVGGVAIFFMPDAMWVVVITFPFVCTLVMGLLAGRCPLIVAAIAWATFSFTPLVLDLLTQGHGNPAFSPSESVEASVMLLVFSSISTAPALALLLAIHSRKGDGLTNSGTLEKEKLSSAGRDL